MKSRYTDVITIGSEIFTIGGYLKVKNISGYDIAIVDVYEFADEEDPEKLVCVHENMRYTISDLKRDMWEYDGKCHNIKLEKENEDV